MTGNHQRSDTPQIEKNMRKRMLPNSKINGIDGKPKYIEF